MVFLVAFEFPASLALIFALRARWMADALLVVETEDSESLSSSLYRE